MSQDQFLEIKKFLLVLRLLAAVTGADYRPNNATVMFRRRWI